MTNSDLMSSEIGKIKATKQKLAELAAKSIVKACLGHSATEMLQLIGLQSHLHIETLQLLLAIQREISNSHDVTDGVLLGNSNASAMLDMPFSELAGVDENYETPEMVEQIQWVTSFASYVCKDNGESGVYDFIFNLAMLEHYIAESYPPAGLAEQLAGIREQGFQYILFNQGC